MGLLVSYLILKMVIFFLTIHFLDLGFYFFLMQGLMLRTNYVAKDGLKFQNLFPPDPKD